jgi:hypothetical protein
MAKKAATATESTVPTLYKVVLTVTEDMLGTAPSNPTIYTDYIASKALKDEKKLAKTDEEKAAVAEKQDAITKDELAMLPEEGAKGVTVFRREPNTGNLILTDTMIRGFLKEGASAIGIDGKSWGLTSKIDKFIFVTDETRRPIRMVPILRAGEPVTEPDGIYERPLRAMTMQGPRVTLAASEIVKAPFTLGFYITVVGLGVSDKGKITESVLRSWFEYGIYTGLGQYRTGGHGRFDAVVEAL